VRHLTYLAVLCSCLASAAWVEPVLRVGVLRRWRRLALTVGPVAVAFCAWDIAAIAAGHWRYDPAQLSGVRLPGRLPLEELAFFLVVPCCAILGFEAVRRVTGLAAGDEPTSGQGHLSGPEAAEPRSAGRRPRRSPRRRSPRRSGRELP
jgi:lycopene cyclase domain-containing protein